MTNEAAIACVMTRTVAMACAVTSRGTKPALCSGTRSSREVRLYLRRYLWLCVCNLVFAIPLYAARRAMAAAVGFFYLPYSWPRTGLTGHNGNPAHPNLWLLWEKVVRCKF